MPEFNTTFADTLARFYGETAAHIYQLLAPLTDEQVWARPYPYGNSIGHLLLHLTGNLNYYIGAEIARTGYVRDRPLEFSDRVHHPKDRLLRNLDEAIALVGATLRAQSADDWSVSYTAKGMEQAGNRFYAFVDCVSHLDHHRGQIIYLCKELERQAAAGAVASR